MEVAMVAAVLVSRYGGISYSEAGEYRNSKIWRHMRSGQKSEVFIEYEAEVSSRVGDVK